MTHTIIVNESPFPAFDWFESPIPGPGETPAHSRNRNEDLLEKGVSELRPGEVSFVCDQTFVFDTTFELKGDGRKFVILQSGNGRHIAKPY
ncbi:MAG: hypothetical protein ABI680_04445 [Chthoniobacteraceae bacterium]